MNFVSMSKYIKKSLFFFSLLFSLAFILAACKSEVEVVGINIDKDNITISVGENIQVTASPLPISVSDVSFTWTTDNPEVATVSSGLITGVSIGEAVITVKYNDLYKTINVNVIANIHNVSFDTDGGTVYEPQEITDGNLATYPGAPQKEGSKFLGWYKDDLVTEFDFSSKITDDVVVYAKWEINKQRVIFRNGLITHEDVRVDYNSKLSMPTEPEKLGYTFSGWLLDNEEFDFDTVITEDLILEASFVANTNTVYTVKHLKYNSSTSTFDLVETETLSGTTNEVVFATLKEFEGMMPEEETYSGVVAPDGSLIIEVKYVEWSYTVEYILNGGNFTYLSRTEMINDFLKDSNTALNRNDTLASIDAYGSWSPIDYHKFFLNPTYKSKWMWMAKYLSVVGSTTNKTAARDLTLSNTESEFTSKGANHTYAFTYEVRGFILGKKFTKNSNWMSSDYSDYQLQNGFWDTFVTSNETTKYENIKSNYTLVSAAYKEGYNFGGWYLNSDFSGEAVTEVSSETKVYAKWIEKNPVTEIRINNTNTVMEKGSTMQLLFDVLPGEAFNKTVAFSSSNDKILQVSNTGLITALNVGVAQVEILAVVSGIKATIEITISPQDDIVINYTDDFTGLLNVGGKTTISLSGVGKLSNANFIYQSKDTNILTISNLGEITAVGAGVGTIDVKLASNNSDLITLTVTVLEELTTSRIDKLLNLIIEANNPVVDTVNASLYFDDWSSFQQYYDSVYGSVNKILFDGLNLDKTTYLIDPLVQTNKTSGIKSSTEFITIHDTANISGGLTNHGSFWKQTTHSTSIHYTVGDYGVVQSLDTKYIAHHAGDGTRTKFSWTDTLIPSNGNSNPVVSISENGYFTFNGVQTSILAPKGSKGEILDDSYFTNLGPSWMIGTNGNYYLGTHWFDTSQVTRGVIASKGGNNNSTGIEMCVNTSGNIYDTWQRTAKLVGQLLIDHNLDLSRVVQHNNFTGKNCPQSLIMSNYWNTFMEMIEFEHIILRDYSDAKITFVSNNPTLVSNRGLVIGNPTKATAVTYNITVEIGGLTKTITLGSVIPGTSSWSQLNGYFSTK